MATAQDVIDIKAIEAGTYLISNIPQEHAYWKYRDDKLLNPALTPDTWAAAIPVDDTGA